MRNKKNKRFKTKDKNINKIKLRNSTRYTIISIAIIIFAISSASFVQNLTPKNITTSSNHIYSATNKLDTNYKVNIRENEFINENSLPQNDAFVSELIDTIDLNLNYLYEATSNADIKYTYSIDSILIGSYPESGKDTEIWNQKENLVSENELTTTDSKFDISQNLKINYQDYNRKIINFKDSLGITINAKLNIIFTLNSIANINNEEIKNTYVSVYSITLGNKIATVNYEESNKKPLHHEFSSEITQTANISIAKILLSLIFMTLSIYVIYYIYNKTIKLNIIKNEFKLELNYILKSCQDKIVMLEENVKNDFEETILIKDFSEIIKLSEEMFKPILCWISETTNSNEAYFYVISNKTKYVFILKD